MNITQVRATLTSDTTIKRIRQAIYNTSKLGWSTDHVRNCKGRNFLALRVRDNKLQITTRNDKDITQLIVQVLREKQKENNRPVYSGETFYFNKELYYTKYQIINVSNDPIKYLCENVLDENDHTVLSRAEIIKLTK